MFEEIAKGENNMAKVKQLLSNKDLKTNAINALKDNKPLDIYVLYDQYADEFIFRIVDLKTPVTTFFVSDSVALLVDINSKEIVGVQFFDFSNEHLPQFTNLHEIWDADKFAKYFKTYKKIHYKPEYKKSRKKSTKAFQFIESTQIDYIDRAVSCAV